MKIIISITIFILGGYCCFAQKQLNNTLNTASQIDTSSKPHAKLVKGLYKIGIIVLEKGKKSDYQVIEFSFRWIRKNFKYEFVVNHKGSFVYPQAMEYFQKAISGDVLVFEKIVAQNLKGKIVKLDAISYVIK